MGRKLTWILLIGVAVVGAAAYGERVFATPASQFTGTTLALGRFGDIDVMNQSFPDGFDRPWLSIQKTKAPSDLYVQSNVWQVGGSTGWHTHPGHSLIIVTSGTLTEYDGECKPLVYAFVPGQPAPTFVDPGRGHVHIVRNEGSVVASSIAVQLVPFDPKKANRRIDAAARRTAPTSCKDRGQI